MVVATISATLASLKTSVDLVRTAVAIRDDAKLAEATQSINDRIIDIQNAALQLQEKQSAARDEIEALKDDARQLRAHVADLEQRRNERAQYRLHEFPVGVFVLARLESEDMTDPMHYLCQPCMDNKSQKNVLQRSSSYGSVYLKCPTCQNDYYTGETVPFSF